MRNSRFSLVLPMLFISYPLRKEVLVRLGRRDTMKLQVGACLPGFAPGTKTRRPTIEPRLPRDGYPDAPCRGGPEEAGIGNAGRLQPLVCPCGFVPRLITPRSPAPWNSEKNYLTGTCWFL